MKLDFVISSWAGCGPGLSSPADWQAWAAAPCLPVGEPTPALAEVPSMTRRRVSPAGRPAMQAAFDVHAPSPETPVVFGSRYGDSERSRALLDQLVSREALSPMSFGLSVHNAVGGLYSIIRGDRANYLSIAAGAGTAAACIVEAAALLADGAAEVLVVCSDTPLPADYTPYEDGPAASWAWAWRVTARVAGQPHLSLESAPAPADEASASVPPALPPGLDLFRFVVSGDPAWRQVSGGTAWTWRRHDG